MYTMLLNSVDEDSFWGFAKEYGHSNGDIEIAPDREDTKLRIWLESSALSGFIVHLLSSFDVEKHQLAEDILEPFGLDEAYLTLDGKVVFRPYGTERLVASKDSDWLSEIVND